MPHSSAVGGRDALPRKDQFALEGVLPDRIGFEEPAEPWLRLALAGGALPPVGRNSCQGELSS